MLPIEFDACVMIVSLKAGESVQGKELKELAVKQAIAKAKENAKKTRKGTTDGIVVQGQGEVRNLRNRPKPK